MPRRVQPEDFSPPVRKIRQPKRTYKRKRVSESKKGNKKEESLNIPLSQRGVASILLYFLTYPFRRIMFFTRGLNIFIMWPIRILLCFGFVFFLVVGALIFFYGSLASRYDMGEVTRMPERTVVLDRKNRVIGRLHGENRESVSIDQVPQYLIDAIITREDKRFYEHGGVDWIGVGRSVLQVAKHQRTTQGASTLTMQVARNSFQLRERTFHRKFLEVALAKRIESTYSKKQILEAYINRIFWGHTYLGISSAARSYFDKEPKDLTLSECALLAGIIYGPNEFSPVKNPVGATRVRNLVLSSLLQEKKISSAEYQQAMNEKIVIQRPVSRGEENYTMDMVRRELDRILEDEDIQLGGLQVQTTLDLDLQNAALDTLNAHLEKIESRKGYPHQTKAQYDQLSAEVKAHKKPAYMQGAVVIIDHTSGAILAMVGGRDAQASQFNRAVQACRQIGSLFKPFVYTTAFERGLSPSSSVSDNRLSPGEIPKAGRWSPRNSDGTYRGMQPAWLGLTKSRNTMSVRIGNFAGMQQVINATHLAGFRGKINPTPASYLGTWEATPAEIASGYTVFANAGVRPMPYFIQTISDHNGDVLHFAKYTTTRVFSQKAAVQTSQILRKVTQPGGTAGQMKSLGFNKPCGGKTGTTDNYTNAWFAGYTSTLTACVWVGMDRPQKTIDRGYGGTLALPIWAKIMAQAEKLGYPCRELLTSPSRKQGAVLICRESGQLAHSGCQAAHTAYAETLLTKVPTTLCTKHAFAAEIVNEGEEEISERQAVIIDDQSTSIEEPTSSEDGTPAVIIDEQEPCAEIVPE